MAPKIGIVFLGHFARLGPHSGFTSAWFEASQRGFPVPSYCVGVSAGAIAAANLSQWNGAQFRKTEETLINLRPGQFYTVNPRLEVLGGLTALAAFSLLLPINKIKNRWMRYGLTAGVIGGTLALEAIDIKELLASDAIFSNERLKHLLANVMDFDLAFNSPVAVEMVAVDMNTRCQVIVSNFRPEDRDPVRFIDGVVDSTRIPGFFSARRASPGHYYVDGAVISNSPIDLAERSGCDTIVAVQYTCASIGATDTAYNHWLETLQRSWDIVVDENTKLVLEKKTNIQNDLEQLEKAKTARTLIEHLAGQDKVSPEVAELLASAHALLSEAERSYSFRGQKKTRLIVVKSREVPAFHFRHFNSATMRDSINIGYDAFQSVRKEIETE